MKINRKFFNLLGLAVLALFLTTSCTKEEVDDIPEELGFGVEIAYTNNFGKILVNQNNQSMYFFAGDVDGYSNCNGGCAEVWPPVLRKVDEIRIDSDLYSEDFSNITREDGQKQLTFKGWPLYYFSPDADGILENPGQTLGDGKGGVFHIAKPDYSLLLGQQTLEGEAVEKIYLVDYRGVTLYKNTADGVNQSNCNGGCAGVWPPFEKRELILPSSLYDADFKEIEREDDLGPQLSFKGSPLYYFSQDEEKRGLVLGQAGGPNKTFFVIEIDY